MTFEEEKEIYASSEEIYMSWWIDEMVQVGAITKAIYQPKPFVLSDGHTRQYLEHLKTKTKEHSINIMNGHKYTADWMIKWNWDVVKNFVVYIDDYPQKHFNKYQFICNCSKKNNAYFSVIDVKGSFVGQGNSTGITFPLNQKWVMQKYGIYVQKVVPTPSITKKGNMKPQNALFPNTFTPEKYLLTDMSGKPRKIKYEIKSINEYLKL